MRNTLRLPVIGRKAEVAEFLTLLDRGSGVLTYYGMAGVGKTTLLQLFEQEARAKSLVVYIDLFNQTDVIVVVENMLRSMQNSLLLMPERSSHQSAVLETMLSEFDGGARRLSNAIQIHQTIQADRDSLIESPQQIVNISESAILELRRYMTERIQTILFTSLRDLAKHGVVCVIFDSLEQSSPQVDRFVESFARQCSDILILVTAGRYQSSLLQTQLPELSEIEIRNVLKQLSVPPAYHNQIVLLSKGNGLCLQLLVYYALYIPSSNPQELETYNPFNDPALLLREFWEGLVLKPIQDMYLSSSGKERVRYGRAFDILRYGPCFFEITPQLVYEVLHQFPTLVDHFPSVRAVEDCLLDPVVASLLQQSDTSVRFHSLIHELGDLDLARKSRHEMYAFLHRLAAMYYLKRLHVHDTRDGYSSIGPLHDLIVTSLSVQNPSMGRMPLLTLDWQKTPQKHEVLSQAWPRVSLARLYTSEGATWRLDVTAFCYHVFRFSEWLGATVIDRLLEQVFAPIDSALCIQLVGTTSSVQVLSSDLAAWTRYIQAIYGLRETLSTLESLLDTEDVPPEVKLKSAFRLAQHYAQNDIARCDVYVTKLKEWAAEVPEKEQATFWREVAYIFVNRNRTEIGLIFLKEALDHSYTSWDRADTLLKIGIQYRVLGNYKDSLSSLSRSVELWLHSEEGDKLGEAQIALGDLFRVQGNVEEARKWYKYAYNTLTESEKEYSQTARQHSHTKALVGMSIAALARCAILDGDYLAARLNLERAVKLHREIKSEARNPLGWELRLLAQIYEKSGEYDKAVKLYEESVETAIEASHIIMAKCCLAGLFERQKSIQAGQIVRREVENLLHKSSIAGGFDDWLARAQQEVKQMGQVPN